MTFLFYLITTLFVTVCVLLILLVLIQKGRGGGLSGAFGGAGGNTAFGSKTGDVLTWATAILFGVFLLLAVGLNLLSDKRNRDQIAQESLILNRNDDLPAPPSATPIPESIKVPDFTPSTVPAAPTTVPSTQP